MGYTDHGAKDCCEPNDLWNDMGGFFAHVRCIISYNRLDRTKLVCRRLTIVKVELTDQLIVIFILVW